ncbi:potassium transporter TrkG [Liquorilactobacillus mali]|uniref:TrkH family potassium uptake protein n=1 Tax=Liquorilactobacillus mali TaxID=1618 RepID=UPI00265591FA|nr:potassium transporter TrkG [Liquorilactobacillus mali]MDN7146232.1 potassium transporter TrkG [Liquorilactobacillus mali]
MFGIATLWTRISKIRERFTPIQLLVTTYFGLIVITFFLLCLPLFRYPGVKVSFLDTFFMAVSTISVTGLSTVSLHEVYNNYGIFLLEFLFQIGGFGVTMIATVGMIITGQRISLHHRQLIQVDMNQPRLSGTVRLVYSVFGLMMVLQFVSGIIFSAYLYLTDSLYDLKSALFEGFYIAISAVTNAGFDVTGKSLMPFRHDYIFLLLVILLILIGGIGFPVLTEFREWLFLKIKTHGKGKYRFSLFSKIAFLFAVIFFVVGAILIFLSEAGHSFVNMPWGEKIITSLFYSATTRNAGLQLDSLTGFRTTTLLLFSILMFIGASPSSVGGGIRTTTIGILMLYMMAFIRGRKNVNIFGRRIGQDDIQKAVVVVNLSLMLCTTAILILSFTEKASLISLVFEVASAFGTTGLSLGITSSLSLVGKCVIIILMFVGRVGMLYMLMLFVSKREQDFNYKYPTEKVIIG